MRSSVIRIAISIAILSLLALSPIFAQKKGGKKQMAITFDELPAAQVFGDVHPDAISYLILDALKKHNAKATGFVVGANIEDNYYLLGEWLNAGHYLGSMTFDNQDINDLSIDKFLKQVVDGADELEPMLEGFGQKRRYFRFPFLHYGATSKIKSTARQFMENHGQVIAHATIVPEDFVYNNALYGLGTIPDSARLLKLRDEYFNDILNVVDTEEQLAMKLAGRPIKQILLLKANRINAIFLDELLTAFEEQGYSFISLDAALQDEIYSRPESYSGARGVGYLDMIAQSKKK